MKPPKRESKDYEKVSTDGFVPGIIEDIAYDQKHKFNGFEGGPDTFSPAVRLKFKLEGCKFPHYSRWMRFNYGEKANLYKRVLVPLVEGAAPDMDFDLDLLKNLKVNTLWVDNGDFQNLDTMRPIGKKVASGGSVSQVPPRGMAETAENAIDEEVPF